MEHTNPQYHEQTKCLGNMS